MLTSKQRAYLRGLANNEPCITQTGKDGLSPQFLSGIRTALDSRELVKFRVLPNSGLSSREACDAICDELGAEPVQVIGTVVVIFRQKKKDSKFVLPEKKTVK